MPNPASRRPVYAPEWAAGQNRAMEIWHNPRCSKSREAKRVLDEAGVEYTERRYLDDAPTVDEITEVLGKLDLEPWDITRTGEARAKELGLAGVPKDRERWIGILAENPVLIQRPILIADADAVVGRDPESVRRVL